MRTTLNKIINATFESFNLFPHYCTSNKLIDFQNTFMAHNLTEFKFFQTYIQWTVTKRAIRCRGSYVEIHNSVSGMSFSGISQCSTSPAH